MNHVDVSVLLLVIMCMLHLSADSYPQSKSRPEALLDYEGNSYKDFLDFGSVKDRNPNNEAVDEKKETYKSKKANKFKNKNNNKYAAAEQAETKKYVDQRLQQQKPSQQPNPAKSDKGSDKSDSVSNFAAKAGSIIKTGQKIISAVSPHAIALKEPHDRNDTARLFGLNYNYPLDALTVGLQFTIPFLNIPLNSIFSGTSQGLGSILSLNKSTLIIAGLFTLAAIFVLPLLLSYIGGLTGLNFPFLNSFQLGGFSNIFGRRDGDSEENKLNILEQVNEALQKHSIDSQTCMKRFICTYVQSSNESVKSGKGQSKDLLIDGLASNWLVKKFLGGTAIDEAIALAREGGDCDKAYSFKRCPLNQSSLYRGLLNFVESDMDF